jgi:hypothetical protein
VGGQAFWKKKAQLFFVLDHLPFVGLEMLENNAKESKTDVCK